MIGSEPSVLRHRIAWVALLVLTGCGGPAVEDPAAAAADSVPQSAPGPFAGRIYERSLAFISADSISVVWQMSARSQPGSVARRARGWLARAGVWDAFHDASWESPPSRVPWRIVPHEGVRLVVGEQDALQSLVYVNGPRRLEIDFGAPLAEWRGPGGGTYQVSRATAMVLDGRVAGLVADLGRSWHSEGVGPGDWAILMSGDSVQVVLVAPEPGPEGRPYRAWATWSLQELQWPEVGVQWTEVRAFEPARRDVPNEWSLRSFDGELSGVLRATSFDLRAGEADGLYQPVYGLFEVAGSLTLQGRDIPVIGLLRHVQP